MTEIQDERVESAEKDQTARMGQLILLCTFRKINPGLLKVNIKNAEFSFVGLFTCEAGSRSVICHVSELFIYLNLRIVGK